MYANVFIEKDSAENQRSFPFVAYVRKKSTQHFIFMSSSSVLMNENFCVFVLSQLNSKTEVDLNRI